MDSSTRPFWTDQKHVNYLNTMEAIFVRTMFQNKTSFSNHNRPILRLDRHLPDTSESTLDLKPHNRSHTRKYHAPSSDLIGPTTRRTRRRTSQPFNSSQDQVVPHVDNESKGGYNGDSDKGADS
ncbi:unnamed protein product [Lathyrus oleraceus]|uniref:Uncharacterized protein n=1 Tax=Pisum sativum TaxID=3888 RepID=A0A9D5BIR8_PEA|nr:uncharacterized protein LOC127129408 isoform X1 [Pisum sativum]KAI5444370.1 hypothetical protein KIW84_012846 [Pisum sativum]